MLPSPATQAPVLMTLCPPARAPALPPCLTAACSYFKDIKEQQDAELLVLETDACIFEDEGFK